MIAFRIFTRQSSPGHRLAVSRHTGIPAASSSLACGADQGAWGTTFTVALELDAPVPGIATQALAGKVVRRLKALAETGEIPTTEHTPAYREGTT